jgi:hypothetical protein
VTRLGGRVGGPPLRPAGSRVVGRGRTQRLLRSWPVVGAPEVGEERRPSLSERIERSSTGQLVISAAVVLFLLVEITTNLPASAITRELGQTPDKLARLMGVEQEWGVFAPNPRSQSLDMEAKVTFADGSAATWHLPDGDQLTGALRYYRWRKWLERVRADDFQDIWSPTAEWIASLYGDRASPVREVALVRRFHEDSLTNPQPPYKSFTYFVLHIDADGTKTGEYPLSKIGSTTSSTTSSSAPSSTSSSMATSTSTTVPGGRP